MRWQELGKQMVEEERRRLAREEEYKALHQARRRPRPARASPPPRPVSAHAECLLRGSVRLRGAGD
jgi:hypothetical protein